MPSPDSYSPLGRWSSIPFSSQMMSWDENQPMIIHDLSLVITEITSPWQQLLNYLVNPQILNQSSMMADSHGTILNSLDCHLQYCNHNKKLQHTTTYYHRPHSHTHKKNKGNQQKTNTEKHPSFIAVSISTHPNKSRILIMIRSITNKNSELLEPTNQIKRFIRLSHLDAFGDAIRTAAIRAGWLKLAIVVFVGQWWKTNTTAPTTN